jgi:hypothetical protein
MDDRQDEIRELLVPPTPPTVQTPFADRPRTPHGGKEFAAGFGIGVLIIFGSIALIIYLSAATEIPHVFLLTPLLPVVLVLGLQIAAAIYNFRMLRRPYRGYGVLSSIILLPLLLFGMWLLLYHGC